MKSLRLCILCSLLSQCLFAQLDTQSIIVQNCTCPQFADGSIRIPSVPASTQIELSRIEGGSAVQIEPGKVGTDVEFNGLVAGNYLIAATDANGSSLSHSISISEPPPIEFSIDQPTDLPDEGLSNGSIRINYTGSKPFSIFYKGDFEDSHKELKDLLTITGLKAAQYDVYMQYGKCKSQNQTVVLSAKNMFSLSWYDIAFCRSGFQGLEAELTVQKSEPISLSYTYDGNNMGSPETISQTPTSKRIRIKWSGFGKYVLNAIGTPSTRRQTVEIDAAFTKCTFDCEVKTVVKPTPGNDGKGSFVITIQNPQPTNYSILVTNGGKDILNKKDTKQTSFTVSGIRGTYEYEVKNQFNYSRCGGIFVLDGDIPGSSSLREHYLENIATPIFRDLVLCECFIKRVNGWDLALTTASTIPLFFTPLMTTKAIATFTAVGSGLVNTTGFFALKGERYKQFQMKSDQLISLVEIHKQIMIVLANPVLTFDELVKYDSLKKVISQKLQELPQLDNPDCPDNRFARLMMKRMPEGLDATETKLFVESKLSKLKANDVGLTP